MSELLDRPLPEDRDAERFVLGAALASADAYPQIVQFLTAEDFALEKHRRIFRCLGVLQARGEVIACASVALELRSRGELESEGLYYLTGLIDMPALVNLEIFCRRVKENSVRRQVISAAACLIDRCQTVSDQESALTDLERMREMLCSSSQRLAARTFGQVVADEGGMSRFLSPQLRPGIHLPFETIHQTLDGLRRQCLTILGARPAVGKTSFAMQVAEHAAANGNNVLLVTLEMGATRVLHRSITGRAQVSAYRFRRGELNGDERYRVATEAGALSELGDRLMILDEPRTTAQGIESLLRTLRARGQQIDLLIVDYLQLLHSVGRFQTRVHEVTAISNALKLITMAFDIPVLALSQLSRKEGVEPQLDWLKDAGQIEQDADQVIFLWRKGGQSEGETLREVHWKVAKNRDGIENRGILTFHARYCRFQESLDDKAA